MLMKDSLLSKRFLASFFLLLFSFCVTPKRFWHDLLANHKDAQSSAILPVQQITASGFHCHIDDLVVVAPFLPGIQTVDPVILSSIPLSFSESLHSIASSYLSHSESRGPPADFCS